MRAVDIIRRKRDAEALATEEIQWFIQAYTAGEIPDYQAAALLMAIFLRGMDRRETFDLTQAMAHSGHMLDLSDITDYAVDKHSSGGVGDKTTLVVLPMVASLGIPVAKMSGRGLGFSGGTLDKLEAIAGYRVRLSDAEFREQARSMGLVLCGQTGDLAPADGKLYALRDVTSTVDSLPLIASSIMSKKLAAGASGIVLDVKLGNGAFMQNLDAARELASIMVDIGADGGRDMIAVLSDMNQPLGVAVGNALEVKEALATLRGGGPADFREHCIEIAHHMLVLAGRGKKWTDQDQNRRVLEDQLHNGSAWQKFRDMVEAQGGDVSMVDDPDLLPKAALQETLYAPEQAYVAEVRADLVGQASIILGAGRARKEDAIDLAVGLEVFVKVGDLVRHASSVLSLHANDEAKLEEARQLLSEAITYQDSPVAALPLFYGVIESPR